MYQTAGSEAVRKQVEDCIGVPFYVREISGRSVNTSLVYDTNENVDNAANENENGNDVVEDEVEDLYLLLQQIQQHHPDITGVSSGAILSTYQRTRIEHVCARLRLTSLSYLWRMSSQRSLLNSILDDGNIEAVLVRTACPPGLMPYRHLGKSLRALRDRGILDQLKDRWGMHPAGEGGEYETLVLDCPALFKYGRLVLEETEVICDASDDGVGILRIGKCYVEKKGNGTEGERILCIDAERETATSSSQVTQRVQKAKSNLPSSADGSSVDVPETNALIHHSMNLPNVRIMKGGLCHISALLAPIAAATTVSTPGQKIDAEANAAVQEFLSIKQMLQTIFSRLYPNDAPATSPQDVLYVHLYLSQISHFASINRHYQQFFGTQLPPSRACVAVGKGALPGGRRVMMDCIVQRGSGAYLRSGDVNQNSSSNSSSDTNNHGGNGDTTECEKASFLQSALENKHHALRKTLHVQSISSWAPVCIGPYSQANSLRSSLVFLAGMIGLVPETMTLIQPAADDEDSVSGWEVQLYQSWKNAAAVLDGLEGGGGKLEDTLGGLVYFSLGALESLADEVHGNNQTNSSFPWKKLWTSARCICNDAIETNAGIVMGSVDGVAADKSSSAEDGPVDPSLYDEDGVLYGGYEDEETWREMSGTASSSSLPPDSSRAPSVPLLMVCLPELPANAQAEVELICASRRAASCLDMGSGSLSHSLVSYCDNKDTPLAPLGQGILWDTGYDGNANSKSVDKHRSQDESSPSLQCIEISAVARYTGLGCACVSTVVASLKPSCAGSREMDDANDVVNMDIENILSKMIDSAINNAKDLKELGSLFTIGDILNVRLYYKAASVSQRKSNDDDAASSSSSVHMEMMDDGSMLRTNLHSVLQSKSKQLLRKIANNDIDNNGINNMPAYTVVPVLSMHLSYPMEEIQEEAGMPLIAMQVTLVDAIRMETEMWVRHNRQYQYDN